MAGKATHMTVEQKSAILKAGLKPAEWKVKQEFLTSLMIVHKHTNEVKLINKVRRK